jgi:hypothetical protein
VGCSVSKIVTDLNILTLSTFLKEGTKINDRLAKRDEGRLVKFLEEAFYEGHY